MRLWEAFLNWLRRSISADDRYSQAVDGVNQLMKLLLLNHRSFMAAPLGSVRRALLSTCSAVKWEGGVSMVQGASRGIGLEFVKQLLEKNEKGHLDLTIESTIEASANSIRERYGSLNLLINASGILSIPNILQPGFIALIIVLVLSSESLPYDLDLVLRKGTESTETTLSKVQKSSLLLAYEVNAVGPILVIKQHMWPLLTAGGGSGTERDVAVVANLSARVGSIGDNRLGGWHLIDLQRLHLINIDTILVMTKTISVEFVRKKDPVICLLLHPGTVDTDLSRPFQRNVPEGKLFTKEFSVNKLLSIINNAKSHDNGKFFAWDGQEIPWLSLAKDLKNWYFLLCVILYVDSITLLNNSESKLGFQRLRQARWDYVVWFASFLKII
ncbi:hypothetical protein CK203_036941 [Vitis vinifera]|uniref:Uncharacterized protein n=1 Tax=Vitis vinifera TaxID=29760 RepID=A0A438IUR1_VITVI|nr:hypothetical protein CK203_036941 [Vitis vinifera]